MRPVHDEDDGQGDEGDESELEKDLAAEPGRPEIGQDAVAPERMMEMEKRQPRRDRDQAERHP